jgi:hypothetical protein
MDITFDYCPIEKYPTLDGRETFVRYFANHHDTVNFDGA